MHDEIDAHVVEALPNDLFRVELHNRKQVLAHPASRQRRSFLRLLPGDRVKVKLSSKDRTRGCIVERCES